MACAYGQTATPEAGKGRGQVSQMFFLFNFFLNFKNNCMTFI